MTKKLKHALSLFLITAVLSSLTFSAFAADAPAGAPGGAPGSVPSGMPPGGMPGGGAPGGGRGGGPVNEVPDKAAIYIKDGAENTASEYAAGLYKANFKSDANGITIQDVNLTSGDYAFNGIVATGAKSSVTLDKVKIILGVTKPVDSKDKGGNAASVGSGAAMYIKNSELQVGGAGRYVTAAYDEAKIVINDSSVTQTGSNENTTKIAEPISNEKLQISGTARANFSVGATKTYYFNSTCTAEGWAALSTDSSTGNGLDLYAYNTRATTQHGGYGTYADFHCRVWLYGSTLISPEIAVIISKSGQVVVADGAQAPADVLKYNLGKTTTLGSTVTGGRNAVMIHAPDMFKQGKGAADCGTFNVINSTLATSKDLKSSVDYAKKYNTAVGGYIDYINGAAILVKSTSVNINLENAKIDSFSGVIAMTVLNSDSMGNYLAEGDAGTSAVKPIAISMKNMSVNGDIKHMDYQRIMTLSLDNATLKGAIVSGTVEEWNKLWSSYNKADCNWVQNDTWNTYYGVQMTVKKGATWEVTGQSTLSSLTVENGGTIKGKIQVDGKTVMPAAGKTLTGKITVKP